MMNNEKMSLADLQTFYRSQLRDGVLPFWLKYSLDREAGGYATCLDADGRVYDWDKLCMWAQGRLAWTFARAFNEFESDPDLLRAAQHGTQFIQAHGFRGDGAMYYALTRHGAPLQGPMDIYTELSTVLGFAEVSRTTGDQTLADQARDLFLRVWNRLQQPGQAFQPGDLRGDPIRLHGHSMITLNVLQELRKAHIDMNTDAMIEECLHTMLDLHVHPEKQAIFELVHWDTGNQVPGWEGRWINPGHMIEGGTFVIHEARHRGDAALAQRGVQLIQWGYQWGWDTEFGGIYNDVDCEGQPIPTTVALVRDSKLWWQHAEALYGLLLAYEETGQSEFLDAYWEVHDYTFSHFPASAESSGEWVAYLDRRGNAVSQVKGTSRKNAFHIGRNFLLCTQLLERLSTASRKE